MQIESREMGGYLELERYHGKEFHEGALAINSARNCLAYLIEARSIESILLPKFLCDSVEIVCGRYSNLRVRYFDILPNFEPDYASFSVGDGEWLYLVDYYGQLSERAYWRAYEASNGRLIVDEVMAFFRKPEIEVDTIYSCRKFLGVSDGAYLYTDAVLNRNLPTAVSFDSMRFVLGRFERPADEFYGESVQNNKRFREEPLSWMSELTRNILRSIDYEHVMRVRRDNFDFVARRLDETNKLKPISSAGVFMYPLLVSNGYEVRKKLQQEKIYVSELWSYAEQYPGVPRRYACDILPLPIDQRYDEGDMEYMCEKVTDLVSRL